MKYKQFHILKEEAKASIASLWDEYVKVATGKEADDSEDTGRFKVVATSDDMDRDGEIIAVEGWDFENFNKNPVLLWGHDFYSMPIGKVTKLTRDGNKIIAEGIFAPTERGQEVRKAYDGEFLNTVSVGFIPRERKGNTITKSELLELSFVPVPANANAVALRAVEELSTKMLGGKSESEEGEENKGEPVEEGKGVVSDVADAMGSQNEQTWSAKWGNMSQVSQIIGALWEVYMRPEVGVDDFDGLLKEAIDLLSGILGARVQSEGLVAQNVKSIDGEALAKAIQENFEQKSGRVLSKKNRELVASAKDALQALLDSSEVEDEKAHEPQNQPAKADDATAKSQGLEHEELLTAVLRGIDKAVGKELRDLKRK